MQFYNFSGTDRLKMKSSIVVLVVLVANSAAFPAGNLAGSARIDLSLGSVLNKQANFDSTAVNQKVGTVLKTFDPLAQILPERPKGREQAVLEHPSIIQVKDSVYDQAQKFVINLLHPKPIVDTIAEHEKYGNEGDQFRSIGNAIVEGYEGFSNFLNAASDLPFETMKQVTRKASSYLGIIGAKLIGL